MIKERIESNQNTVVGVAIGVVVVMLSFCIIMNIFLMFLLSVPEHAVLIRHVHHGQIRWMDKSKLNQTETNPKF